MVKNPTLKMGNCNHRKYIPHLLELVESGGIHPETILSKFEGLTDALSAYRAFDKRQPGWMKVELEPKAWAPELWAMPVLGRNGGFQ